MSSGYLLVNKPKDWTSFDVVKKIRNILKIKKIGHIGTLDPFATGLLVILIDKATKYCQYLMGLEKEYEVVSKYGISTDTGDITGIAMNENTPNLITRLDFEKIIPEILKINKQIPSKFSAIKINGKKAYKLARAGEEFDIPEREIEIKEFELTEFDFPVFKWRAVVSKGTYIRTLTEQIADLHQNIAVTTDLVRTRIGEFHLKNSVNITDIKEDTPLCSIDDLIKMIPLAISTPSVLKHRHPTHRGKQKE